MYQSSFRKIAFRVFMVLALVLMWRTAHASSLPEIVGGYDVERLATAIYHAEGGAKTAWPYGILKRYKTTTPRQACINTIRNKHKEWVRLGSKGDYLEYLQSRYCPTIGVLTNDEKRLNIYWLTNVRGIYAKQARAIHQESSSKLPSESVK